MNVLCVLLPLAVVSVSPELEAKAKAVADQITANPTRIKEMYHASFLAQLSENKLKNLYKEFHAQHGRVISVSPQSSESGFSGKFTLFFEKGVQMTMTLTIANSPPHQIIGIWFGPPTPSLDEMSHVLAALKELPGKTGFELAKLSDEPEVLCELNPDEPFAIGSTFKLYVLAALITKKRPWDEVIKLDESLKSLPSGSFHTWPDGAPMTLHTLASAMISVSDNTATDRLIAFLGRESIEAQMRTCGNEHAQQSFPFLTTLEMFKIKSDSTQAKDYARSSIDQRRALLNGKLARMSRDDVHPFPDGTPVAIDTVEWFASPADLVRLMDWFRHNADDRALQILTINRGLDVSKEEFPYAGYKGGSEPGVLNMTWLLQRKDGTYFALTGSWNSASKPVDLARFSGLMQSAINIFAKM